MSLNDTKIRSLKPSAKPFKVSDSHGLYLLVNPGGSRLWYLKYRINGKESRLSLGPYPDVSLAYARQQRDGIRKLLAQNINPAQQRIAEKTARSPEKTFKHVALSWHKSNKKWSQNTADRLLASLNNHVFPVIGHLSVSELKPRHFIDLLKSIEQKGLLEVASRTRQHLSNIMRHAVHQGLIDSNPAANLDGVTAPPVRRHYPALPWSGCLN
ncbi:Putative prophage CPS-53 integrase [Tatumella ptyseos]|uniref:Prophage CPS-53 integrase n=1 Tax=Tatumella ptyseos TaxID=82987 RepID=A0A2X5PPU8_9GAMM|nr:Putative prophage CPS-53 integrase [Tatumella ptyseos]